MIGAPGLEPCDVCGSGFSMHPLESRESDYCRPGICREVVRCYDRMCVDLIRQLPAADRKLEDKRCDEMTRANGKWYGYVQDSNFRKQMAVMNE